LFYFYSFIEVFEIVIVVEISEEHVSRVAQKCSNNLISCLASLHRDTGKQTAFVLGNHAPLLNGLKYGLLKVICNRAASVGEMHPYVRSEVSRLSLKGYNGFLALPVVSCSLRKNLFQYLLGPLFVFVETTIDVLHYINL
jgi:hypothetical protein